MPGRDGSRAISTIKFLLDDKAPGARLQHTWNAQLKAACRDDARDSLNLFTSDSEESADATEGPTSSTDLQNAAPAQDPSCAASTEVPRQPPLPAEAAGGPAPACPAGNPQEAPSTPAQDTTAASTVQESVSTAAADSSLAAPSCTPLQLSGSSGSTGNGGAETVPEQPANADPAGASTAAGPSTPALSPMQGATGAKPAAEAPTPPAQVAEEEGAEEYRGFHKALNLLRHVQASTKLPQCLQPPPKRPQLMQPSTSVAATSAPGSSTAGSSNRNSSSSSSSVSSTGSVALITANSKPRAAAAVHKLSPAGDAVDALLAGRPSSSRRDSHDSAAGKLCLGARTSSASLNSLSSPSSSPQSSRIAAQQPQHAPLHQQPQRSQSFTSPAAALAAAAAAAAAPSSGASPAGPARCHTNGAAISSSSSSSASALAALYEPTQEDLKPYLAGAPSGEGLEAFIQRRLQQPPDVDSATGTKLAKLPATQRYMATIAVGHKQQRQQLQRLPSGGEHGRQRA